MIWNFEIDKAPRDASVILASKCGKVTRSRWIADEQRWQMLGAGEQPVAWMLWPIHPTAAKGEESHG